jgi:hypothetical protein
MVSEQEIYYEAAEILLKHLGPEKFARFWASWNRGGEDYLEIKEDLFKNETVETLCDKIEEFQKNM